MQRYLVNKNKINKSIVLIEGNDVHHIKNVMRMKIGENILVFTENKELFLCEIIEISDTVQAKIVRNVESKNELNKNITIAQGLINRDKTEEVIRRLVELGCNNYQPVIMDKSIIKYDDKMTDKKNNNRLDRLNRIIKEASEQSQRINLMNVYNPIFFNNLIKSIDDYDLVLFCHVEFKDQNNIKEVLKANLIDNYPNINNILVIIGPESGYSKKEIDAIMNTKAIPISLGKRVLRTETAPLSIMSILAYEVENYHE